MGQARQRQAEIEQLKKNDTEEDQWNEIRPLYVKMIKEDQEKYLEQLYACAGDTKAARKIMQSGAHYQRACDEGLRLVVSGIASIDQIKDAAWEGFNGLIEACCVQANIQQALNLPVTQLNMDDFIITGPDAVKKALARGWF